ncbi:DUF4412 domain-containing protein [Balneola vulgaris]|uniref:DUF4412 domain-containing protein n=1 Tax=Balneola vulgaris TaxID=287535 RepID=UPI00036B74A7|nr:DUF4412 domain-containing protein [Balneola vulgaris]
MKSRLVFSFSLLLFSIFVSTSAIAQFQGQITMNIYSEDNGVPNTSELNMFVTAQRIFVKGENEVSLTEGVNSGGILIRNDMKDFIILMDDNDALQVTKSEIEGLFKMFSSMSGSSSSSNKRDRAGFEYTGKTKSINGYETSELRIWNKSKDENGEYISVWLTPNVDINWGMLAQTWENLPEDADEAVNQVSQEAIFKSKNFPMLIEVTSDEGTEVIMEVTNIYKTNLAKAMVEIPAGVNLIGVSDLMFKVMSGGR